MAMDIVSKPWPEGPIPSALDAIVTVQGREAGGVQASLFSSLQCLLEACADITAVDEIE